MISIQVSDTLENPYLRAEEFGAMLVKAAEYTLAAASDLAETDAVIVLTDDEQIADLNRTYLGANHPTDVLSFPNREIDPETGVVYLGDVVISYSRAEAQAAAGGHPVEAELLLLVVHGMLHLCNFDHVEPDEKAAMWKIQSDVLGRLNSPISGPSLVAEP